MYNRYDDAKKKSVTHRKLLMTSVVILVDVFKFLKRSNFSKVQASLSIRNPRENSSTDDWLLKSKKKGYRRYWSRDFGTVSQNGKSGGTSELALQSNMWSLFNKFSQKVEL